MRSSIYKKMYRYANDIIKLLDIIKYETWFIYKEKVIFYFGRKSILFFSLSGTVIQKSYKFQIRLKYLRSKWVYPHRRIP